MRCTSCNSDLNPDASFCSRCGTKVTKVENVKMVSLKCNSCNGTLTADKNKSVLICPYCGARELIIDSEAVVIEKIKTSAHKEIELERIRSNDRQQLRIEENERRQDEVNRIEKFKASKWSKFLVIAFIISALITFVCFSQSHILTGICSLLQTVCFAIAWLMGMQIIKEKKRYLHVLVAIIGIILMIPTLKSCTSDSGKTNSVVDTDWSIMFLGNVIPEPSSKKFEIHSNTEEELWIDVLETSEEAYYKYIIACKDNGFTNEMEETSIGFEAYNDLGYKLSVSHYEYSKEMGIHVIAPTQLSALNWDEHGISEVLPAPVSTLGTFETESEEKSVVIVGNVASEEYEEYCSLCQDRGFTIDIADEKNSYSAYNADGYAVSVSYNSGNQEMRVTLRNPMKFMQIMWPTVGVGTLAPIPHSLSGHVSQNLDWSYSVYIENTTKADYEAYVQECIDAGFDKDTTLLTNSFWSDYSDDEAIKVSYEGNNIMYISVSGSLNKDYSDYKREPGSEEIITTTTPSTTTSHTTTTTPTESLSQGSESEYELAFVRDLSNYDLYLMFDTDNGKVIYFGTDSTYVMEGIYTGSIESGVDINWVNDGWHETFINANDSDVATLIDGNGFDWEYKVCDISIAQRVLDDLRQ